MGSSSSPSPSCCAHDHGPVSQHVAPEHRSHGAIASDSQALDTLNPRLGNPNPGLGRAYIFGPRDAELQGLIAACCRTDTCTDKAATSKTKHACHGQAPELDPNAGGKGVVDAMMCALRRPSIFTRALRDLLSCQPGPYLLQTWLQNQSPQIVCGPQPTC